MLPTPLGFLFLWVVFFCCSVLLWFFQSWVSLNRRRWPWSHEVLHLSHFMHMKSHTVRFTGQCKSLVGTELKAGWSESVLPGSSCSQLRRDGAKWGWNRDVTKHPLYLVPASPSSMRPLSVKIAGLLALWGGWWHLTVPYPPSGLTAAWVCVVIIFTYEKSIVRNNITKAVDSSFSPHLTSSLQSIFLNFNPCARIYHILAHFLSCAECWLELFSGSQSNCSTC